MGDQPVDICVCMGQPVAGNPTHFMMIKAFEKAGLDWQYFTIEVSPEDFPDAMRGMKALRFRGANITIPHKQSVLEFMDELSDAARLCGAVNCITRKDGKLIGDNTDGRGFLNAFREITDPESKRVVILGAGGAARAIAVELALAGTSHITVVNRDPTRGQTLVDLINENTSAEAVFVPWEGDYVIPEDVDLLIQGTSIGMNDPNAMPPIDIDSLRPEIIVADVVFNPKWTKLLLTASERGCTTLDGLGMLIQQGVIGFKNWADVEPDANVMLEAVEEFLSV